MVITAFAFWDRIIYDYFIGSCSRWLLGLAKAVIHTSDEYRAARYIFEIERMVVMFRKTLGNYGELMARTILEKRGYVIINVKFYTRYGEVDLIAKDRSELVFIEVKTRIGTAFGSGVEAITKKKRERMIRTAFRYLQEKNYQDIPCRFDILALNLDKKGRLLHYELITNAFGVEGGNYY